MKKFIVGLLATVMVLVGSSAQAHVSILPGVSATGSTTTSLTEGQSGYLNFRIGHGCTLEQETLNPKTKTSMVGTHWATKSFSVEVPVVAQGTGTTIPKAAWIPGWKSKVIKDVTSGNYIVTWTAASSAFAIPDGPEGDTGAKHYFEFGLGIKWASATAGQKVYFKSVQTCQVDVPGVAAVKKTKTKPAVAAVKARSFDIKVSWDVTDGSGADLVPDLIEHNTAPSVTVLALPVN